MNRDIGKGNIMSKQGTRIKNLNYNSYEMIQILNKFLENLDRKYDRIEKFLKNNEEILDKSYYSLGYYNGLTRGYDEAVNDLINCIKENGDYV